MLEAAIGAGIGALQLRDKDLLGKRLLERASRLALRRRSVKLLINDRADVALAAAADGVQLPADGLPVAAVRELIGPRSLIGRSLHRPEELPDAAGADFVVFGPVFDTPAKRVHGPPQGLSRLAEIARLSTIPVVAIGGMTPERVRAVLDHGAAGVAVMGAILDAPEPAMAVEDFRRALVR